MNGRRIVCPFGADGGLIDQWPSAGDYWFNPRIGWCAVTPDGSDANLSKHQVIEHDDGTITVSPSILVSHPDPYDSNRYTGTADEMRYPVRGFQDWHGYLERGVWRQA